MVATISPLKVNLADPGSVADLANYYASARYYTGTSERPGVFFGSGAAAQRLKGIVAAKVLSRMFVGKSPDGKKQLTKVRRPKPKAETDQRNSTDKKRKKSDAKEPETHVPGFDLTFSAPKTVCVLWALADERTRREIEHALDEAVRETLQYLESELKLARRGKAGKNQQFAKLIFAMFDHTTSRSLQPLLHRHVVILNMCQGVLDKKWGKVNSKVLFQWYRTLGPMMRNTLYQKLHDRLGVEAYRPLVNGEPAGWFELRGVSEQVADHWSSRRKEILAEVEVKYGKNSTAQARQEANLLTRKPKGRRVLSADLDEKWRQEAAALGVTRQTLLPEALGRQTNHDMNRRMDEAITEAARFCLADQSYFSRQKFLQAVSEALQDVPISGVEVARRADAALLRQDLFRQVLHAENQEPIYTSLAMWQNEQKLLQTVDVLMHRTGATVAKRHVDKVLQKHADLIPEQAQATRQLLETPGALKCLTGVAGAGKTRTLNAVREAFEQAGYRVVGTALSGAAKEELAAKAQIETRTVASYAYHLNRPIKDTIKFQQEKLVKRIKHDIRMLYRAALGKSTWQKGAPLNYEKNPVPFVGKSDLTQAVHGQTSRPKSSPHKLDKKTVLIVDEAGMLSTHDMRLLLKTAEKTGATVIAVGDTRQLSPIGPGGPFQRIIQTVPSCHLSQNLRQKNVHDVQAAVDLRSGRVDKMLESYVRRGLLTVAKDRTQAVQKLVTAWSKDGCAKRPEQALILTQTREEARYVNRLCQQDRQLDGQLGRQSVRLHGAKYHVGDRVMFHQALRRKGIENGFRATITAIHPVTREITMKLDRTPSLQQQRLGHTQFVTLKPKEIGVDLLTLGYAATTAKLQGGSAPQVYCLMGGRFTDQNFVYTQITRGEQQTKLFIDRHHAGPKLTQLAESLRQSNQKRLAHDLGLRLEVNQREKSS